MTHLETMLIFSGHDMRKQILDNRMLGMRPLMLEMHQHSVKGALLREMEGTISPKTQIWYK